MQKNSSLMMTDLKSISSTQSHSKILQKSVLAIPLIFKSNFGFELKQFRFFFYVSLPAFSSADQQEA